MAEAVNRRYIADVIPPRERTAASVAFVTASALGMSAGPALAAVLYPVDFRVGRFPINSQTAPAWLMVLLWGIFVVAMVAAFREPTHRYHNHHRRHHRKGQHPPRSASTRASSQLRRDEEGRSAVLASTDEETVMLRPQGSGREGYGAVLQLTEEARAGPRDGTSTPPEPPHFMTPSSTISQGGNASSVITPPSSSFLRLRRHPLAKIHPILLLVWRNKPLMITLAGA